MYMLQLFERDNVTPVDVRLLDRGTLTIGRDPASDWSVNDPECALSRIHCAVHVAADGLAITALGTNGVCHAITGARLPAGEPTKLTLPVSLSMGRFRLVAMLAPHAASDDLDRNNTMILAPPLGHSIQVPSEWNDAAEVVARCDGTLLEAFCEGAGLDPSLLSAEEPDVIMHRAGALYRQMVLGIGDLMAERDAARARYQMTRTTIASEGNNPFKWAPSQRLAIDLLLTGSTGFLTGPTALRASFRDLKRHLVATFAGFHASLRAAIESFDPASLAEAAGQRAALFQSRTAAQVEEVSVRHANLSGQIIDGLPGSLDHAFVTAYKGVEDSMEESSRQ